jgi:2-polyprenyl-6-methoxyphenol hydroxylase-like FAD-dependent oxidoreductase
LNGLGLSGTLRRIGEPIKVAEIHTWRSEVLSRIPARRLSEKVGAETTAVYQADLQGELLRELGEGVVRLGAACRGFEQDDEGVRVFFADGAEERGDLLVGVDGLSSTIREGLLGDGAPRYTGYTAWRTVVTPENEPVPRARFSRPGAEGSGSSAPRSVGGGCIGPSKSAPEGEHDLPVGGVRAGLLELCAG